MEVLKPESRAEWLALRKKDVTASDVAALLGCHPHKTYYELYCEKAGLLTDGDIDAEATDALVRGQLLESVGVQLLKKEKPNWIVTANTLPNLAYFRDTEQRLGATPDAFVVDDGKHGIVQIKSIEPGIFDRVWRNDAGEIDPPLHILAQVMLEMKLSKAEFAYILALRVGYKVDYDLIKVDLSEKVMARIEDEAVQFWNRVDNKQEPPMDYRRDGKLLALLEPRDNGQAVSLPNDEEFVEALNMRASLKAKIKEAEEDLDYYETLIKKRMGPAAIATTADWYATYKTQERSAYSVPAGSSRVLRVRKLKGGA